MVTYAAFEERGGCVIRGDSSNPVEQLMTLGFDRPQVRVCVCVCVCVCWNVICIQLLWDRSSRIEVSQRLALAAVQQCSSAAVLAILRHSR